MSLKELQNICLLSLSDSKAFKLTIIDLKEDAAFTECMIIATSTSSRHAKSVSDNLIKRIKDKKINFFGVEGEKDSDWILIDCGNIVINIMKEEVREFYDLEGLWGNGKNIIEHQ